MAERDGLAAIGIRLGRLAAGLRPGASVAINGVCLTATSVRGQDARFDVVAATRQTTNLGALRVGAMVNVERSLRVGDEVGGHMLSGHVAATCTVSAVGTDAGDRFVVATVPEAWLPYLLPKGFAALNGASLTLAEVDRTAATLRVNLIPETLARTTFDRVAVADELNLEVDARTQALVEAARILLPDIVRQMTSTQPAAE